MVFYERKAKLSIYFGQCGVLWKTCYKIIMVSGKAIIKQCGWANAEK
jgi:hypothetical protein